MQKRNAIPPGPRDTVTVKLSFQDGRDTLSSLIVKVTNS